MSDEAYHYDDCELCERDAKSCTCPVGPQNDIDGGIKALIAEIERLQAESGARLSLLKDIRRALESPAQAVYPDVWKELCAATVESENDHGTREHPPRQVSGSRSLETPDAAPGELTYYPKVIADKTLGIRPGESVEEFRERGVASGFLREVTTKDCSESERLELEITKIARCSRCGALPRPSLTGGTVCPNCGTLVHQPLPEKG